MSRQKLEPYDYIQQARSALDDWIEGIQSGEITACERIKQAFDRWSQDRSSDEFEVKWDKVDEVIAFFSLFNIKPGIQLVLHPYETFIIANIYGLYYKDKLYNEILEDYVDKRKYETALLFIGKKNAKTTFVVILSAFELLLGMEDDPHAMMVASDKTQAGLGVNELRRLVSYSPDIAEHIRILGGDDLGNLVTIRKESDLYRIGQTKVYASNRIDTLDGPNPSAIIFDEVHTYKNYELINILTDGNINRTNPLTFFTSTAGYVLKGPLKDYIDLAKRILDPAIDFDDPKFFALLFELDKEDDPNDESVWIKANPTLGSIKPLSRLREKYQEARMLPSKWPAFLTKHLNIFQKASGAWIDAATIAKVIKKLDINGFKDCPCWAGMDLSATRDMSALTLVFKKDGKYYVFTYLWIANNQQAIMRKGGIDLTDWIKAGYIIKSDLDTIDYDVIIDKIVGIKKDFDLRELTSDPNFLYPINTRLKKKGVKQVTAFRQTKPNFTPPIQELEKAIYDGNIIIDENPCLEWMFQNIVIARDSNDNVKFEKNKDKDAIDGCISLAEAIGACMKDRSAGKKAVVDMWKKLNQ